MTKQTGVGCKVKSAKLLAGMRCAAAGAVLLLVSGCASTWHNSQKTPAEAKADEGICAAEAEDTALARAARQKVDYGRAPNPVPGLNRGETPMQLQERSSTEGVYTREFESCMASKGYSQGRPERR